MSVTTDTIDGQSRLLLARAGPRDSGNYTCVPGPGAAPTSVTVHVLNGNIHVIQYRRAEQYRCRTFSLFLFFFFLNVDHRNFG